MLVLARQEGDGVSFPDLDIEVTVLKVQGTRIQLGIEASKDVRILRSELVEEGSVRPIADDDRERAVRLRQKLQHATLRIAMAKAQLERGDWERAEQLLQTIVCETNDEKKALIVSESKPIYATDGPQRTGEFRSDDCFVCTAMHAMEGLAC